MLNELLVTVQHRSLPIMFAVLLAFPVFSQQPGQDEKEVHIGVKAGVSIPNLVGGSDFEVTRDYRSRVDFNLGAIVDVGLTRRFSIQTGLEYAPQGGKRNGIQPITSPLPGLPPPPLGSYYFGDFKNTAKLNYLEVPVLFKYTWKRKSGPQPYLNAGPYFGYLMKATQVTRGTSTLYIDRNGTPLLLPPAGTPVPPISFDADTDVTDELHRTNIGFTGGGGLRFPHKKNYYFVDVRGSYGFRTLQKDTVTDGNSKTGYPVISFGYAFKVR